MTFGCLGHTGVQTLGGGGGGGGVAVNQYATIAELYAAKSGLSEGDRWEITAGADADARRVGIIDGDGIDGLSPHPFETTLNNEFFPINSATMAFGAIADGKILKVDETGAGADATLTATSLRLHHSNASVMRVRLPVVAHRPVAATCRFTLNTTTNGEQVFHMLWTRTADAATTIDAHGARYRTVLPTLAQAGSVRFIDGTETTNTATVTIPATQQYLEVIAQRQALTAYYNLRGAVRTLNDHKGTIIAFHANNGMDLDSASENFYLELKVSETAETAADFTVDIESIGISLADPGYA